MYPTIQTLQGFVFRNVFMTGIYGIHNKVNDKWYVGQAQNIKRRNTIEKCNLKNCNKLHRHRDNKHFSSAWQKYGEDAFEWVVLEECTIEQLDEREIFWIAQKDSFYNGYNLTSGGKSLRNRKHTNEEKIKIGNSNRGKIRTLETRQKLSDAHKGKKQSAELVKKRAEACKGRTGGMKGKHHSEEAKRKISLHYNRKTVPVICLQNNKIYKSIAEASKELKVASANIVKVCKKERKNTKGYTFEYIKDIEQ